MESKGLSVWHWLMIKLSFPMTFPVIGGRETAVSSVVIDLSQRLGHYKTCHRGLGKLFFKIYMYTLSIISLPSNP